MTVERFDSERAFGYKQITTFYEDFSIAERIGGVKAIEDTFNRAFKEWKSDYKYLTELVMVLNWKMWRWADSEEDKIFDLDKLFYETYLKLWEQADAYACENLKGEELSYFYRTTD